MVNISKWIYNYNSLNPDNQLLVAEAIVNELRDNEITFDDGEYDKEKSKIVREFFELIINNVKQAEELKKFANIFERYEELSQDNRKEVINKIIEIIVKYLGIQEQEEKVQVCRKQGHINTPWKRIDYIETIENPYWGSRDYIVMDQWIKEKRTKWVRECKRCGYVETVMEEPQELIKASKEKNKKARIKRLEDELKRLKNE